MLRPPLPHVLAALALAFLFGADAIARPRLVPVPQVVGHRVGDAARRLAAAGLDARLLGPATGDGVRVVTGQMPRAGTRARVGARVRVAFRWAHFGAGGPSRRR